MTVKRYFESSLSTGSPYNYANLIASEGGSLKWWNIYNASPLVGSFGATTEGDDESVLAIGTNSTDKILVTADTRVIMSVSLLVWP